MRRLYLMPCALLAVLGLAPTPGDIGGCGQSAEALSARNFYASRRAIECRRCDECGLGSRCDSLCEEAPPAVFPEGCEPLVHDGTVCLRALEQAACSQIRGLVLTPPAEPPECQFCPLDRGPSPGQ